MSYFGNPLPLTNESYVWIATYAVFGIVVKIASYASILATMTVDQKPALLE